MSCTPQLATYDPRDASAVEEESFSPDALESEFEQDDDLLTYEPPEASGDESLDFGTASPPDVGLGFAPEPSADEVEAPSEMHVSSEPAEEVASSYEAEASDPVGEDAREGLEASDDQESSAAPKEPRPDRVGELLAGFDVPSRSSREVAGELKSMLGLPLTPAPPPGSYQVVAQEDQAASQKPASQPPPAPIQFSPPRNPRLGIAITTALLAVVLAALIALYVLYPALLIGH